MQVNDDFVLLEFLIFPHKCQTFYVQKNNDFDFVKQESNVFLSRIYWYSLRDSYDFILQVFMILLARK
jgi:hypothetical protein